MMRHYFGNLVFFGLVVLLLPWIHGFEAPPHIHAKFAYVTWTKDKGYDIKVFAANLADPKNSNLKEPSNLDWVAKGRYQNMVNKTGWAFLEVETKTTWPDEMQSYAAGMAEGFLTQDLIVYFWKNNLENYCKDKQVLCKYMDKFISQNANWMVSSIKKMKDTTPYWYQVNLLVQQFNGLFRGFQKAANGSQPNITIKDFIWMNLLGDLGDLESALNPNPLRATFKDGHCSALIKVVENNRDLFASHVTWTGYTSMIRIIKRYNFAYKRSSQKGSETVPGASISFSSYPAMLYSMDDYYLSSAGLLIMETTIGNYNMDLWKNVKPQSLFTSVRTMVANRLATNGKMWTTLFSRYNSGTYNNQWMVLDYNAFEPNKPKLNDDVLWVLEQLPGLIVAKDETEVLRSQGFWSSYNAPYFEAIFNASGSPKMVEKYGDAYSYKDAPRAKIFNRDVGKVEDIDTMMELMRYNNFQKDPFSKCNCTPPYTGEYAISARCDLNPANGTYPIKMLGHRPHGGTDMKLTTLDLFLLQRFIAIGGPTYDPLPPFKWSTSDYNDLPHYGMPDKFEFGPIIHHWKWL